MNIKIVVVGFFLTSCATKLHWTDLSGTLVEDEIVIQAMDSCDYRSRIQEIKTLRSVASSISFNNPGQSGNEAERINLEEANKKEDDINSCMEQQGLIQKSRVAE